MGFMHQANDPRLTHSPQAQVRNEEWPPEGVAALLSNHPAVPVEVRVVWADGTEEWVRGRATRWIRPVVLVELADPRRARVWLAAHDVRRLDPGAALE